MNSIGEEVLTKLDQILLKAYLIKMKKQIFTFLTVLLFAVGCTNIKPFQPSPPEYKKWGKKGNSEEAVKQQMLSCGYPYVYGFSNDYIPNDVAMAERCMFNNGFHFTSGYAGICSLENRKNMPACTGRKCIDKTETGCARDSLNRPVLKSVKDAS